eukprot:3934123-Rhodomonas_salina.1
MERCTTESVYSLDPVSFQDRFKEVLPKVIDEGVELVGMTSPGTNRPAYRTPELSKLIRRSRVLTSARRDSYLIDATSTKWTCAIKEAFNL